jgi:spermidine synthase
VITVFVQLYESSPEAVKSEIATFFEVFPNGVIFGNEYLGEGYDTVLVGQLDPGPIDVGAIAQRVSDERYEPVRRSLQEIGFNSVLDLYGSYAGRATELTDYLRDAPINTDRNLRLQYLAGLGLNQRAAGAIYNEITRTRRYPEDLFVGSEQQLQYLRSVVGSWAGAAYRNEVQP